MAASGITVDGKDLPWEDGITLADLLKELQNVELCSVIRLNGKLVSSPNFAQTRIPEKAVIELLPLVAGG